MKAMADPIPPSARPTHGFYLGMGDLAQQAWPLAMVMIARSTAQPLPQVRCFLDGDLGLCFSRYVRLYMNHGATLRDAISSAVEEWSGMKRKARHPNPYGQEPYTNTLEALVAGGW